MYFVRYAVYGEVLDAVSALNRLSFGNDFSIVDSERFVVAHLRTTLFLCR